VGRLSGLFSAQRRVLRLRREVAQLRRENDTLKAQNESMRQGMRRCVTCEYRLDFKTRQGSAPVLSDNNPPSRQL